MKGDGATKNDCERNAAKRLLGDVRREQSALEAHRGRGWARLERAHIQLLKQLDMRFIVGAKPADHKALFEWVEATSGSTPAR